MERALDDAIAEFSVLLLVAAFVLIGASLLGLGASLPLAGVVAVVSAGLFAVREPLQELVEQHYFLARIAGDLWIGTSAATVTVLVALGATPGELQTLGGLVGLAGMFNYFVRPVYRLAYRIGRWVSGHGQGGH